jgi:hypothetical protein
VGSGDESCSFNPVDEGVVEIMEMALGFTGNSIYCRDDGDGPR